MGWIRVKVGLLCLSIPSVYEKLGEVAMIVLSMFLG